MRRGVRTLGTAGEPSRIHAESALCRQLTVLLAPLRQWRIATHASACRDKVARRPCLTSGDTRLHLPHFPGVSSSLRHATIAH